MPKCRTCGAEIVWIRTPAGKTMPCDATPVCYKDKPGGRGKIVTPNGTVLSCEYPVDDDKASGVGYVPHWATCSDPERHRR